MYDDGAHNDGMANDGVYGVDLEIEGTLTQYYIYAENNDAGMFSPQRAEHEYHSLTATTTSTMAGDLVINEFMASNDATAADQDGEYDDWIELYNNSSSSIDLEGYYLSDDPDDLTKWTFPAGTSIAGNGYLIIWADDDENQAGLHTTFKLSAAAESVLLMDASATVLDEVTYVDQTTDISFGRFPNGTGDFQTMNPTFNAENSLTTSTSNPSLESFTLKAFPNPADESFYLEVSQEGLKERAVSIYNLNGVVCYQGTIAKGQWIDTSQWASGMYVIRVDDAYLKVVIN